jgi:hypothetical protein
LLEKAIKSLRQKTRFSSYSNLLLGALPFLGPLAAYRAVDPACHVFLPSLLRVRIPLGNGMSKPPVRFALRNPNFWTFFSMSYLLILKQRIILPGQPHQNEGEKRLGKTAINKENL